MKKIISKIRAFSEQSSLNDKSSFLLLFVLLLIVAIPFLFFGKIFLVGDAIQFSYPAAEFFGSHYLSGLNPNLYLGFPVTSSFHYDYFNPVYLIFFKLFNFLTAYNLIIFLDLFLGASFFYLLARNFFLEKETVLVSVVVYLVSQFSVFWLNSITITNGFFLLPALCFTAYQIALKKYWYVILIPFILGYAFLSAHYQFLVMGFVGSCVFLAYLIWERYDKKISWIKNLTPAFLYLGGFIGGILLGAPQILNTIRSFKYITRSDFIVYEYIKLLDMTRYILPDFNVFKLNSQEFVPYIGVSLLLVLLAVIFQLKKDMRVLFFSFAFLLFFSLMFKYSPTAILIQHLPIFEYFSQPVRWLYVCNLFLALLAGYGFQFLIKNRDQNFFKAILKYWQVVLVALSSLFLLINLVSYLFSAKLIYLVQNYFDSHLYAKTSQLPLDYYHDLIKVLAEGVLHNFSFTNLNVVLFFIVIFFAYFILKHSRNDKFFARALLLLIVFNLLSSYFINTKFTDKSLIINKPVLTKYILNKEGDSSSFRVFSYAIPDVQYSKIAAIHPRESLEVERFSYEGLVGNNNDLAMVGGLEPNGDKKVQQIIYFYLNVKDDSFENKMPLLSVLNTKYIVTPYILNGDGLELATSTTVTKFNVPLYLYENKKVLPRIFLPKKVTYIEEGADKTNLEIVMKSTNDFASNSYIECNDCKLFKTEFNPSDSLTVVEYLNEYIAVDLNNKGGRWLIFANGNVVGWKAYLDNVETKIYSANYILQGIYVPKGNHKVELIYKTNWYPSL